MKFEKYKPRYRESRFGNCPICGYTNGHVNISCNHWFVCHEHKTKWFAGSNLFADWQSEREVDWLGNAVLLGQYRDVESMPPRTLNERRRLLSEQISCSEKLDGIQLQNKLARKRILVIDDDPLIRASCIRIFNRNGYYIQATASANEGLKRTLRDYFDCVLVDLKLPDMNGMEIVRSVRATRKNIVVLIMTGYSTPESAAEAKQLGVADYIHKPFEPEKLVRVVEHALHDVRAN